MNNKVLVFNIEHPENKFISPVTRNYNILCGVYQFKEDGLATQQWQAICNTPITENTIAVIRELFSSMACGMVKQIPVSVFRDEVKQYGVNFHLPEVLKMFEKKNPDGTIEKLPITIARIHEVMAFRPKTFQGYLIYGMNGERTKIVNPQYRLLRQLKGNRPIALEQWNIRNLFYLYWRLLKDNTLYNFIQEFEVINEKGYGYSNLFAWFASLIKLFTVGLFKTYHHSFVKKSFDKHQIPYTMKPMCGDLHTAYRANKIPITCAMVEKYIFEQPASKIYWRLFYNNTSASATPQSNISTPQ
jgi:hypothetical protein